MDLTLVSNILAKNSNINSAFYSFWRKSDTKQALKICRAMKDDDSIADVSNLKKLRDDIEHGLKWIPGDINIANSLNYGIKQALFPFENQNFSKPSIEHGAIFYEDAFQDVLHTAPMSCVTMAPFRVPIIQAARYLPVFTVGPYIQYPKPFYNEHQTQSIKNKFGSVLLVFPAHSTDLSRVSFDEQSYIATVKNYAKSFNTVFVCAFWWNINDSLIKRFESEGYKIVSAGFRDDVSFLPRLKTIIQIADKAIGNSIGTHVGYCYNLKTPFELIQIESCQNTFVKKELNGTCSRNQRLSDIENALSSKNIDEIDNCMQLYWGNGIFRTENERKIICEITSDIARYTHGFFSKTPLAISRLYNDYKIENKTTHSRLLKEASSGLHAF